MEQSGAVGRCLWALAVLVVLTRCGGSAEPEPPAPESQGFQQASAVEPAATVMATATFTPISDARVEEALPTRNLGIESTLIADLSPRQESYLRFSLNKVKGTVTRARLRLYVSDGTSDGPQIFSVTRYWSEAGLTWSTRPARLGGPLADAGALTSGTWVEYDVTGAVNGSADVNLVLVPTSSDGADFVSREGRSDLRPQLVVTYTPEAPAPAGCMLRTDAYRRTYIGFTDGTVSQSEPNRNFSSELTLQVDGSPRLESYLQFDVDTQGMTVRNAWLEFFVTNPTSDGPLLYRARSDWSEQSLTWNTRPGLSASAVGNLGAVTAGSRVTYDLTGVVADWGGYGFGLLPESTDGVAFSSSNQPLYDEAPRLSFTLDSPLFCSYHGAGGGLSEWKRQYGGAGDESLGALAPRPQGGFVAAGRFGSAAFPPEEGLALAQYSATGSPEWSRVVSTEKVRATHVTVTSLGNILVVGQYMGSPNLGTGPLPFVPQEAYWYGLFIAKFSPTGQTVWARGFTARDDQGQVVQAFPAAVATDANGSLLVTGGFAGRMDLGGGVLASDALGDTGNWSSLGGFAAKFSWEGQHVWSRAFQSGDDDAYDAQPQGHGVAADSAGNVLVAGAAGPWTNLGDGRLGMRAPFIAKYSPTGALLWKRVLRGAYGVVRGIQPQGTDRIIFIGNVGGSFTFAGGSYFGGNPNDSYRYPPNTNGFIGALTGTGADVWLRSIGTGTGYILDFQRLAVSEDGLLTVSGRGREVFELGGGSFGFSTDFDPFIGTSRTFVARYSASGQHQWSRVFDVGRSFDVALQPGGAVVLGATLAGVLELEGQTYTPVGESDLFYLKVTR
ncbi:CBM96 family carbohydrate-binding protein [Hyalangium versicolor]|uniref:CBM96 family carbohydrate-binding protein n=1 Tax=Hyalangium versicolor TaxID=2861190 RepID=UPI001CCC4496|nr:DNRLRE domain-containing protein [Hyalangium versicolor]